MKKLVSLILIVMMLASFASCKSGDKSSLLSPKNPFDEEVTTVDDLEFHDINETSGASDQETESDTTQTEPVDDPQEGELVTASFLGCGDNILYTGTFWEGLAQAYAGGRQYNFKPIYSDVASAIAAADISYINQETLMDGGEPESYPAFNSPQDLGYDLVETGFDVINLANNHMLDRGGAGLQATIDFWKNMDATMIGGNANHDEFDDIEIIERNGIRVALLSYCEMTNLGLGNGYDIWIPYLDKDDIKRQCDSVKDRCDFIICSVHWGEEQWNGNMRYEPTAEQKEWAQYMADCGVDAIIGSHPHVIEPIEYVTGKDGNRTLCVYSLGNFMAMQANYFNMLGGMIKFDICKRGNSHAYIDNVVFEPTVYYFAQNWYGSHIYYLSDFNDYLASTHGLSNYGVSITVDMIKTLLNLNIDDEFLPEEFRSENNG